MFIVSLVSAINKIVSNICEAIKQIILRMLVNLRKNRDHHKQNSEHITINPSNHLRANTPTDLKTYRASRQEQDECSICPSIEKLKLT